MTASKALTPLATLALMIIGFMAGTSAQAEQLLASDRGTHECNFFVGDIYDQDCDLSGCQRNDRVAYIKVIIFDRTGDRTLFEDLYTFKDGSIETAIDQLKKKFSNVCGVYSDI